MRITKDYRITDLIDLQEQVEEIAPDFTLGDFFRLCYEMPLMQFEAFSWVFGVRNFREFWKEAQKPRDKEDEDDIKYLELFWGLSHEVEVIDDPNHKLQGRSTLCDNGKAYFDAPYAGCMGNLLDFHGRGKVSLPEGVACPADMDPELDGGWAIEFTPVNNLVHLPIRMNVQVEFPPPYVEPGRELVPRKFSLTIRPTLWCFITSIFWELTFCGQPDERDEKRDEIVGLKDEAMRQFAAGELNDDDCRGNCTGCAACEGVKGEADGPLPTDA